jgi:predicted esterase
MPVSALLLACVLLSTVVAPARAANPMRSEEWKRLQPSADAPAHEVFAWTSKEGLRFAWCLPKGYDAAKPRNLTVILHGTGLDHRWGFWNNKPGIFRPDDVVVSVDGTTPDGEARVFLGDDKNAKAFREFLHELRASFTVDRVFLYGHSQGGFFVVHFAGEFPDEVAGVVAHASGAWNWSKTGKPVKKVAIGFMHGTLDPVVPYRQSPGSRDFYAQEGFELLHLRRLERYNHWPNAVRANEALAWCQGMTAKGADEALGCAAEMLRPKKSDEYQWETVVDFSGARDVLRRLVGQGPVPLADVDPKLVAEAEKMIGEIESEGARHVETLVKALPAKKALVLDGKPWLGHLIAVREDFRGVDSVEKFVAELGFDKLAKSHATAASKIFTAWYDGKDPKKLFEIVTAEIGDAFLIEGYPPELAKRIAEIEGDAKKLKLSKPALAKYADFEKWKKGWDDGVKEYESLWRKWKGTSAK